MSAELQALVDRCQKIMAHAWMVRTFVKHSTEAEDFPELMCVVRGVFDTSRALETRVADPPGYLKMLGKKLGKLRAAAAEFRREVPAASTHTNFQQAIVSIDACVADLEAILQSAQPHLAALRATASATPIAAATDDETHDDD